MMGYKKMPFPWISKSKLGKDDWCKYQYYEFYVMKKQQKRERITVEGTNMHMVVSKFFSGLKQNDVLHPDLEKWGKLLGKGVTNFYDVDHRQNIRYHPFRKFIYERCMEYIPPKHRGIPKLKQVVTNFSTLECKRWVRLNEILSNKKNIFDYFKPIETEQRDELDEYKLFGTVDRVDVEVMANKTRKILVIDYKTGNVPKAIKDGLKDPSKQFSWKLGSDKMKELHFYGLMYLLKVGWKLSKEIRSFLLDDEWLFVKKKGMSYKQIKDYKNDYLSSLNTRKNNRYKIFKDGNILNQGDVWICIYYLGGEKPYRVIKEFNYRSFRTLILAINDLRSRIKHEMYTTHPKYVFDNLVCDKYKNCSNYQICKEMVGDD